MMALPAANGFLVASEFVAAQRSRMAELVASGRLKCESSYPQQDFCCWIGGHGTLPYEQNTQQSPAFGRRSSPQPVQS